MRVRTFVIAGASALAVGSLAAGLIELDGAFVGTTTSATTPIVAKATSSSTGAKHHHWRHHRRVLPGFAGSFQVWSKAKEVAVTWSWAKGTLDSLTSSSVTLIEPSGASFTAPLGAHVRFYGTTRAVAETEHGVRVTVVERDGTVVLVAIPRSAKA
jgi:hypothetical protein